MNKLAKELVRIAEEIGVTDYNAELKKILEQIIKNVDAMELYRKEVNKYIDSAVDFAVTEDEDGLKLEDDMKVVLIREKKMYNPTSIRFGSVLGMYRNILDDLILQLKENNRIKSVGQYAVEKSDEEVKNMLEKFFNEWVGKIAQIVDMIHVDRGINLGSIDEFVNETEKCLKRIKWLFGRAKEVAMEIEQSVY